MGFIFGLLVGAALSSGGDGSSRLPPSLSQIPFRCFAAIEQSDDAYRACRRLSMAADMAQQCKMVPGRICEGRDDYDKAIDAGLTWEIAALHKLADAAQAQQKQKQQ